MSLEALPWRVSLPLGDPERIASLLQGASFPAALWSGSELRFTWANRVFRDLLEDVRPQWDLLGMPVRGFLSDSHSASRFIDVAYTGQPITVPEYEFRASWGEITYWQLTYLPVPGRVGDPFDVLFIGTDVTAVVINQRELAVHEADLRRATHLIDVTVLSSLDAEDILQRVLIEATEVLGADWGWIAEREQGAWVFRNVHGWPVEMTGLSFAEDELSLPALAARSGRSMAVSVAQTTDQDQISLMGRHDIGAFALVPLKSRGDVTGVMGFCWDAETEFAEAHRDLLKKLELSLSFALENARQYAAERRLNRTLRGAFFGTPQSIPGFQMGHLYHAASGGGTVGGDFYDVVPLPSGYLGVLIGDVAGHGIEAAGLTSLVRSAMRAQALREPSPRDVMRHANDLVLHGGAPNEFVSAFFGVIDGASGHMAYSVAGHPAPILLRDGVPTQIPADGGVLGAERAMRYDNHEAVLEVGDTLVMFTDGLIEARSRSGECFGVERLMAMIGEAADEPVTTLPETLFLSAFGFADGRMADDVAIVALRRESATGASDQGRLELSVA